MRTIAPQVLDKNIGGVGLGRKAVVAHIDTRIRHGKTIDVEGVETICVLRQRRLVCRNSIDVNVVEGYVLSAHHESRPAWRIFEMEARDFDVGRVVGEEEDGSVEFVVRVENFRARKAVPPCLAVSVDHARTIDLDIPGPKLVPDRGINVGLFLLPAPCPECNTLLEVIVEVISLPVLDVVGELGIVSYRVVLGRGSPNLQLAIYLDVDIIQERQI